MLQEVVGDDSLSLIESPGKAHLHGDERSKFRVYSLGFRLENRSSLLVGAICFSKSGWLPISQLGYELRRRLAKVG